MKKILKYFALFFVLFLTSCATFVVPEYDVDFEPLPPVSLSPRMKPVRIVHISDFHSNDFGENEEKLIKKVRLSSPDIIVMTGDIFDFEMKGEKPLKNVEYLLDGISGLCPIFYVTGNHEYYNADKSAYKGLLAEKKVIIAEENVFELALEQGNVVISGIADPQVLVLTKPEARSAEKHAFYLERLKVLAEKTTAQIEKSGKDFLFSVLLAHRPEFIDEYKACGCFDLILSGHAHGGQWRIPGLVNGVYAPGQGYFPKYAGGRYDFVGTSFFKKNTVFVVSRGLSYQAPLFPRFFNMPELVVIDISVSGK